MAALDALTLLATVSEENISYTKQGGGGHQIFSIIMIMTELYECFLCPFTQVAFFGTTIFTADANGKLHFHGVRNCVWPWPYVYIY